MNDLTTGLVKELLPDAHGRVISLAVSLRIRGGDYAYESVNAINELEDDSRREWADFCVERGQTSVGMVANNDHPNLKQYARIVTQPYDGCFIDSGYRTDRQFIGSRGDDPRCRYLFFLHRPLKPYIRYAWKLPARYYFSKENATLALAFAQEVVTWEMKFIKDYWIKEWGNK